MVSWPGFPLQSTSRLREGGGYKYFQELYFWQNIPSLIHCIKSWKNWKICLINPCWTFLDIVKFTISLQQQQASKYVASRPNFPISHPLNDYSYTIKIERTLKSLTKLRLFCVWKQVLLQCSWVNMEWYFILQARLFFSNPVCLPYSEELKWMLR